ncbi:hypothetical protein CR513_20814 [Mucuna pruriens]|uniref:Uncharacterized protein n=1 Tax=Mucuna pruriens TaxID=157652 RepID=A0A371H127_MUCPR|nr:hypothetical protein CR513_20814 [Mucuna pruriens]
MEKLVRSCDKEYMRMAMLKHEETFKEQVYELHRLYRIQKILMQNMEARRGIEVREGEWYLKNAISLTHKGAQEKAQMKFDLERPAEEHIAESEDGVVEVIDETEIELTLGPSSYNRRKKVETPLTSDSGHSLSSCSSGSSHVNKTRCHTTREESSGSIIRLVQVPGSTPGYQSGIRNSFDIEEHYLGGDIQVNVCKLGMDDIILDLVILVVTFKSMYASSDINMDTARLSLEPYCLSKSFFYPKGLNNSKTDPTNCCNQMLYSSRDLMVVGKM